MWRVVTSLRIGGAGINFAMTEQEFSTLSDALSYARVCMAELGGPWLGGSYTEIENHAAYWLNPDGETIGVVRQVPVRRDA